MGRASTRFSASGFVVLTVAFTMIVSVAGSGGYVFLLHEGSGKALSVAVPVSDVHHPGESGEDEADPIGNGGITLGLEALGESFAPVFPPPPDGGYISSSSTRSRRSPDLPGIYRPPIS